MPPTPDPQQPGSCARCGGVLVPIAYGYPGLEMIQAEERGEIMLGGCTMDPGMPTGVCRDCGQTWGVVG